jgi:hypothetical protein
MEQNIVYGRDVEQLLKSNAEECESLSILHRFSYEKYNQRSNYINIPVIILSSAIGFATGIDIGYDKMNIILGIGSIFVGIIKSIDTYFQLQKRAESHRLCSLQYGQINKKIAIELALPRPQRINAKDMLGLIKTDMKNLADISPLIDKDTIRKYNKLYTESNVHKPNMVNGLSPVNIRVDTTDLPSPLANEPIPTKVIQQNVNDPNVSSSLVFPNQSGGNNLNPTNLNGMSVSADLVIANLNNSSRRPSLHSNLNPPSLNVNISDSNSNTPRLSPSINIVNEQNNAADDAGAM